MSLSDNLFEAFRAWGAALAQLTRTLENETQAWSEVSLADEEACGCSEVCSEVFPALARFSDSLAAVRRKLSSD